MVSYTSVLINVSLWFSTNYTYSGSNLENSWNVSNSSEASHEVPLKTKKLFVTGMPTTFILGISLCVILSHLGVHTMAIQLRIICELLCQEQVIWHVRLQNTKHGTKSY